MSSIPAPAASAYARHTEMTDRSRTAARERQSAVVERVEDWVRCYGLDAAAERFPGSAANTARMLYRAGRHDLARPFERIAGKERRARERRARQLAGVGS